MASHCSFSGGFEVSLTSNGDAELPFGTDGEPSRPVQL